VREGMATETEGHKEGARTPESARMPAMEADGEGALPGSVSIPASLSEEGMSVAGGRSLQGHLILLARHLNESPRRRWALVLLSASAWGSLEYCCGLGPPFSCCCSEQAQGQSVIRKVCPPFQHEAMRSSFQGETECSPQRSRPCQCSLKPAHRSQSTLAPRGTRSSTTTAHAPAPESCRKDSGIPKQRQPPHRQLLILPAQAQLAP
jgi:hypothetical protein